MRWADRQLDRLLFALVPKHKRRWSVIMVNKGKVTVGAKLPQDIAKARADYFNSIWPARTGAYAYIQRVV